MPRPLGFRSRRGTILAPFFFFLVGFVLTYMVWFSFALSPLEKLYLPAYMTLPMTSRTMQTLPVWWILKTGPKHKPELAIDADVVL